jgi:uncharacterized protein (TIGR00255 family)
MTYSMTGFGSATGTLDDYAIEIQVKSVNYRGLDIHLNLGPLDGTAELRFTEAIKRKIGRGRIDVSLTVKRTGTKASGLNEVLFAQRVYAVMALMGWTEEKSKTFVLGQADVWRATGDEQPPEAVVDMCLEAFERALDRLSSSRRHEGKALRTYMLNALDEIETHRQGAMSRAPERVSEFERRLNERLSTLSEELNTRIDDRVLATEVALLADKIDVTEELTRIGAHVSALRILLLSDSEPTTCIGKKIDFYLQELGRESTTLASKSRDTILTRYTIDMRTIIESMREQSANIQ